MGKRVMTRRWRAVLAAATCVSLAACGAGDDARDAAAEAPAPDAPASVDASAGDGVAGTRWREDVTALRVSLSSAAEMSEGRLSIVDAYKDFLEEATGLPVRFYRVSDYNSVIQALSSGQLDMATMGPAAYASVYEQIGDLALPILTLRGAQGERGYYSTMLVRADSAFQTFDDMAGRTVAFVDRSSTSGYLYPRQAMREAGHDPDAFFGGTPITGGHSESVIALANGQFDGAVVMVAGGTPETGFLIGAHTMLADMGVVERGQFREIWYAGPIPNSPYVVRADRPQAFIDLLRGVVAATPYEKPNVVEMFGLPPGLSLGAIDHDYLAPVIAMRADEIEMERSGR